MRDVPEYSTDAQTDRPGDDTDESSGLRRRQLLGTATALSVGGLAGCLNTIASVGGGRVAVEPEPPGEEPDASPEEFYYVLEENGITVDELYHDPGGDAESETNEVILFYESEAETMAESDEEVRRIYRLFRDEIVAHGTDLEELYTENVAYDEDVSEYYPENVDEYDGQVGGWGANARWARRELDGEVTEDMVFAEIVGSMQYPPAGRIRADDYGESTEQRDESIEIEIGDENATTGAEATTTTDAENEGDSDDA
ncbi:hypothetical protein [Halopiger goleimassiliensis]|uniref:hypothetical protein n=1 Tax=Halopiger goleimassiliensis TaxID=1293048 RepID=UPI000677D04F|nr:hypothetical protein [Halopiger goleimassiliensis]